MEKEKVKVRRQPKNTHITRPHKDKKKEQKKKGTPNERA